MLKRANFLILDEPTNHLDIESKEALEASLLNYDGTIMFVSHDRYFIQKLSNSIMKIEDKKVQVEELDVLKVLEEKQRSLFKKAKPKSDNELSDFEMSQIRRKLSKQAEKLLEDITQAEEDLEDLRELRYEPDYYHDFEKMDELNKQIDDTHNQIAHLVEEWTKTSEELEELEEIMA